MSSYRESNKLVIDLGNSRVKVAVFGKDDIIASYTIDHPSPAKLSSLDLGRFEPVAAIISSVSENPGPYVALFPDLSWITLDAFTPLPIRNHYKTPESLGKDRLAAVVGAHMLNPGIDQLVVDAGTALTFDLITGDGNYMGGSISPGLSLRFRALHTFTARLPLLEAVDVDYLTGKNTHESILSGVINGMRAEIDGIINEYKELRPGLSVILTGGDTNYFEKILKNNIFAIPNLVLTGLKLILDHNFEN